MPQQREDARLLRLLGLAKKAGKLKSGEFSTEKSVKSGASGLCLAAGDASESTKKHFRDMCRYRKLQFYVLRTEKEALGKAIGCSERAVVSIEDRGFVESLISIAEGGLVDDE